jgi:hypothetical protein
VRDKVSKDLLCRPAAIWTDAETFPRRLFVNPYRWGGQRRTVAFLLIDSAEVLLKEMQVFDAVRGDVKHVLRTCMLPSFLPSRECKNLVRTRVCRMPDGELSSSSPEHLNLWFDGVGENPVESVLSVKRRRFQRSHDVQKGESFGVQEGGEIPVIPFSVKVDWSAAYRRTPGTPTKLHTDTHTTSPLQQRVTRLFLTPHSFSRRLICEHFAARPIYRRIASVLPLSFRTPPLPLRR